MTPNGPSGEAQAERLIRVAEYDDEVRLLSVRYDGTCFAGDAVAASDLKYKTLWRVETDDLVLSNINAVNGAIGVVPAELRGCFVSPEFTVLRARPGVDPRILQLILRSPECRVDLLLLASGIGRHRVTMRGASQTRIPLPLQATTRDVLADLTEARELQERVRELQERATSRLQSDLGVDTPRATELLQAFKPPK
jgi:type I restriction enzyme M protein